jgi:hypothetical protein
MEMASGERDIAVNVHSEEKEHEAAHFPPPQYFLN